MSVYEIQAKDYNNQNITIFMPTPDILSDYDGGTQQFLYFTGAGSYQEYSPGFDPRITVMCYNSLINVAENAGFENIIDYDAIPTGGRFTLSNGNYIEKQTSGKLDFFYADGSRVKFPSGTFVGLNAPGTDQAGMRNLNMFLPVFNQEQGQELTDKANELYAFHGSDNLRGWIGFDSSLGTYDEQHFPPSFRANTAAHFNDHNFILPHFFSAWSSGHDQEYGLDTLNKFYEGIEFEADDDPYNNPAEDDTGTGFDDGQSDAIGIPSLPQIGATDTGFITLYNPTLAQLQSLSAYMWSSSFDLDTFKKIFANPMQAILGMSILPIAIPSSSARNVKVGNIDTGISMNVAANQFLEVDCGSITIKPESPGSYLDYSPYTKAEIYLPFIGTHPLQIDEIMGKNLHVVYHVDILSGACTAFIKSGDSVLYTFIGSCAISVPITGNDWTQAINGVIGIAGAIGSMVMTGGATAPAAAATIASNAVNNLKPNVEKSGAMGASGGLMGVKTPYIILTRPRRNVAKNQNKYIGYPTYKGASLGSLSGYNKIDEVHLKNISGTEQEVQEIERLLKEGVVF